MNRQNELSERLVVCSHMRNVLWYDSIDSTMDQNEPHGTVVIADEQKKGRGRFKVREWHSPKGGVWLSYYVNHEFGKSTMLSVAAGVAAQRAISKHVPCRISWVNDLFFQAKKIGGILIEAQKDYAVVGVGINTNVYSFPKRLEEKATSIALETGGEINNLELIADMTQEFDKAYSCVHAGEADWLIEEYNKNCYTVGKRIRVSSWGKELADGTGMGLDRKGRLQVKQGGEIVKIIDGEVTYLA